MTTLSVATVHLNVKNLELMKNFYEHLVGLDMQQKPIVSLHATHSLSPSGSTDAGLYHLAILFSSRGELARSLARILQSTPQLFSGSADHLVSEAFYLNDPEGNGIELYVDRDRSTWRWEHGHIQMASQYIDPMKYIQQYRDLQELQASIQMGHIHLKVGDIAEGQKFYVDILGFDITAQLPSALFVSMDGYHHHIGMNAWESAGAGKRTESLGLRRFDLVLSNKDDLLALKERLNKKNIAYREEKNELTLHDPWNNEIVFFHQ